MRFLVICCLLILSRAAYAAPQAKTEPSPLGVQLLIPQIYLDAPLMTGIDDEALRDGPGFDTYSDLPGRPGNCVLAAHRNVWGAWFWHLPKLRPGALIELRTAKQRLFYRVTQARTLPDSDTSALQRPSNRKVERLTLYTCTKPRTPSRFVVVAERFASAPLTAQAPRAWPPSRFSKDSAAWTGRATLIGNANAAKAPQRAKKNIRRHAAAF